MVGEDFTRLFLTPSSSSSEELREGLRRNIVSRQRSHSLRDRPLRLKVGCNRAMSEGRSGLLSLIGISYPEVLLSNYYYVSLFLPPFLSPLYSDEDLIHTLVNTSGVETLCPGTFVVVNYSNILKKVCEIGVVCHIIVT